MDVIELLIIAVALSMDAFAVAICKGLSIKNNKFILKYAVIIGIYFGFFQALMPLIGYLLGAQFSDKIKAVDHWIVFILLFIIGAKMIWESFATESEDVCIDSPVTFKTMFPLAIATSIDALAVGVGFAFLNVDIIPAILFIGIITFILSLIGVKLGNLCGTKFQSKAEFTGGVILILMGIKILLEHLEIIHF